MTNTKSDVASPYAVNVIDRGASVTAHELDRLQSKLAFYADALERLANAGLPLARDTLEKGRKI